MESIYIHSTRIASRSSLFTKKSNMLSICRLIHHSHPNHHHLNLCLERESHSATGIKIRRPEAKMGSHFYLSFFKALTEKPLEFAPKTTPAAFGRLPNAPWMWTPGEPMGWVGKHSGIPSIVPMGTTESESFSHLSSVWFPMDLFCLLFFC